MTIEIYFASKMATLPSPVALIPSLASKSTLGKRQSLSQGIPIFGFLADQIHSTAGLALILDISCVNSWS
jgi:hypothetical protein